MMIDNTPDLTSVCQRFATAPYVTIDTEFIREKTYYPDLCLIQIASPTEAFCIDPLATDIDLTALFDLLQHPDVVKVFHAGRQDIEIFYHLSGKIPSPLFDTQIGAMVCGFGDNVSYQQLVQTIVGVSLDKSMRCTNWAKRPLTPEQIQYALYDVTHLRQVYEYMCDTLTENNRMPWIHDELKVLLNKETYHPSDEALIEKLHLPVNKPQAIHVFRQLYLWRENLARRKNRPRRFLIKDELLQELSLLCPTTPEQLTELRGVGANFDKTALAGEILSVIRKALQDDLKHIKTVRPVKPLTPHERNLAEILKLLLSIVSVQEKIAVSLIACSEDIAQFIHNKDVPFLSGWRYQVFGQKAEMVRDGLLSIRYVPQNKQIEFHCVQE